MATTTHKPDIVSYGPSDTWRLAVKGNRLTIERVRGLLVFFGIVCTIMLVAVFWLWSAALIDGTFVLLACFADAAFFVIVSALTLAESRTDHLIVDRERTSISLPRHDLTVSFDQAERWELLWRWEDLGDARTKVAEIFLCLHDDRYFVVGSCRIPHMRRLASRIEEFTGIPLHATSE